MADTALGIFLENLERLISCSTLDFIVRSKEKLQSLHDELVFLRDFLENSAEKHDQNQIVKNLMMQIRDLAHKAETIVDWFTVESFMDKERIVACKFDCLLDHQLGEVRDEIGSIKIELKEIYVNHEVEIPKVVAGSSSGGSSRQVKLKGKMVVGFDDEATRIIQELDDWQQRHLSIISIVGAGGAGKTTLASKVYHDCLIQERFPIRGWIVVSQVYDKKDLLISILKSTSLFNDGDCDLSCDQLGEQLYRRLRDKKYLVVIDDIWSVQAWTDIERSFPDDGRGSRVLFTTRMLEVGEIAQHHHNLLPLSSDDSWDLLQRRVFGEKISCPSELVQIGMEVAEKCGGLPLAIVVIAGILEKTLTLPWWEQVAKSLSSIIAENDEVCMKTLALSYNHLPLHLKACFLYLGAFPEDCEIPVRKLIFLWIAEGFVKQSGEKTLEDLAEGYLMELVGRSLVMVAQKNSGGGIKACRIHDLLRELCTRKAKEEFFSYGLRLADGEGKSNLHRRLCCIDYDPLSIADTSPNLRTYFDGIGYYRNHEFSFLCNLNLLSVLDLSRIYINMFPRVVVNFVHLRYLSMTITATNTINLPPSISNLWNLETLILDVDKNVNLPEMGNTTRLRHLLVKCTFGCTSTGRIHFENPNKPFSSWDNLQTLDRLCPCEGCLAFLKTIRNLKKLGIYWYSWESGNMMFRDARFSEHLEELELSFVKMHVCFSVIRWDQVLPLSIRKLTLCNAYLPWKDMTILGQLPCLEVLKLSWQLYGCTSTRVWNTNDDEFCRLRYLELDHVDLREWNSCADHFPKLETLVLEYLYAEFTVLPSDFADLTSLEKIVVTHCGRAVKDFARQIKEKHHEYHGDYRLQVIIEPVIDVIDIIDVIDPTKL